MLELKENIKKNLDNFEIYLILSLSLIFLSVLLIKGHIFYPGWLAKVDFISDFGLTHKFYSWSDNNFGYSSGLNIPIDFYSSILTLLVPDFKYRDTIFYFIFPIFIFIIFLYIFIINFISRDKKYLTFAYYVLFLVSSQIFYSIFLYGWNLLNLIPLSGLLLAFISIKLIKIKKLNSSIFYLGLSGFFIGSLFHLLVAVSIAAFFTIKDKKDFFIFLIFISLGNSYVLIPELYKTFFSGMAHYKGLDPIAETLSNQAIVSSIQRISGIMEGSNFGKFSLLPSLIIFSLALFYFINLKKFKKIYTPLVSTLILFGALNFSGLFWDISLNRIFTFLPVIGGMFRNLDKIYFIFFIALAFFASISVLSLNRPLRIFLGFFIFFTSLYGLSSNSLAVANVLIPNSYTQFLEKTKFDRFNDRILLTPTPSWFHRYDWADHIQIVNVLNRILPIASISDEMNDFRNISPVKSAEINNLLSGYCDAGKKLGITFVGLQKDILDFQGNKIPHHEIENNLNTCFGNPVFESINLNVYKVPNSLGRILTIDQKLTQSAPTSSSFIFLESIEKIIIKNDQKYLIYKNIYSPFTLILISINDNKIKFFNAFKSENQWFSWPVSNNNKYYIINLHKIISIFGLMTTLLFLIFGLYSLSKNYN